MSEDPKCRVCGCDIAFVEDPCEACIELKKEDKQTGIVFPVGMIGDNAFSVLGKAIRIIRESDLEDKKEVEEKFLVEAKSGDYNHLCKTVKEYFEVI